MRESKLMKFIRDLFKSLKYIFKKEEEPKFLNEESLSHADINLTPPTIINDLAEKVEVPMEPLYSFPKVDYEKLSIKELKVIEADYAKKLEESNREIDGKMTEICKMKYKIQEAEKKKKVAVS